MGADSKIQWTDHTFNPWWGCARVSPGCEHCYAEAFAKRTGKATWGVNEPRRFFGQKHWDEPLKWNRVAGKLGERQRVFCASMADVFEDRDDLNSEREKLWALIEATPHLDWLLLMKRPQNVEDLVPWCVAWPRNVWLGTTAEDQKRADERIPHLVRTGAAVKFLSCEPLLGPLDLKFWLRGRVLEPRGKGPWLTNMHPDAASTAGTWWSTVNWVIVGGESGPRSRIFDAAWALTIVEDCQGADVPTFVKQYGATPIDSDGDGLLPLELLDRRKGADMAEWAEDLRVRSFPVLR